MDEAMMEDASVLSAADAIANAEAGLGASG